MKYFFSPPNSVTFLRILLTPVFVIWLLSTNVMLINLSLVVFIIMGITDWYDGYVARRWGYVTKWGTFFDPLADKIATTAALVAFISLDLVPAWPIWIMVFRDVVVTAFRTAADIKGKLFDTSKGAKIKTFLQFVVIYYILVMYVALRTPMVRKYMGTTIDLLIDYTVLYILITITAAITVWTGLTYFIENWDTVKAIISRQKENGTTTP